MAYLHNFLVQVIAIIVFNFILYYRTISYGLIMDDEQWYAKIKESGFLKLKDIKCFNNFQTYLQLRFYGGTTFGTNTKIEHAFTLSLHTLASILVFVAFGRSDISFWASILYSCNPINHSTAIWLNGRRYLLSVIAVLLIMILYNYGIPGKGISILLYFFAGCLQVTAFFTPVIFGFKYLLFIAGIIFLFRNFIKSKFEARNDNIVECDVKRFTPKRLIVIVKSYGFYFSRILVPGICALIYPYLCYWGKNKEGNENAYSINMDFWRGVGGLALTTLIIYLSPIHQKTWAFFMGVAILQWCNIVPVIQTVADRYVSVSVPFLMYFLSYFLSLTGIFYIPSVILIATYYYVALYVVLPMYRDLLSFYEYQIKFFPKNPIPLLILVESLLVNSKIKEAEGLVQTSLFINPKDYELLNLGALFCLLNGDKKNGLIFCDEAEKNFFIGLEDRERGEIGQLRDLLNKIPNNS